MVRAATFVVFCIPLIASLPAGAAAQVPDQAPAATFTALTGRVHTGQRLVLTTEENRRIRGRLENIDASHLLLRSGGEVREFREANVREVRQRGDRLWNGALLGAGAGGLGGALIGRSRPGCAGEEAFCGGLGLLVGLPLGAIAGLAVDAAIPHDHVIFTRREHARQWMVAPLVSPRAHGVMLTAAF